MVLEIQRKKKSGPMIIAFIEFATVIQHGNRDLKRELCKILGRILSRSGKILLPSIVNDLEGLLARFLDRSLRASINILERSSLNLQGS